jgi:hypothetical protein
VLAGGLYGVPSKGPDGVPYGGSGEVLYTI